MNDLFHVLSKVPITLRAIVPYVEQMAHYLDIITVEEYKIMMVEFM